MKKKLFVCLLALALLVTAGVFAVQAETQAEICPHCQKAMESISWASWSFTDGEIAGGHYYLDREYVGQTGQINIPAGQDVCLDLRGAVYFAQNIHPFDIYGTLTVMDSGENGQFITTGKQGYSGGFAKIKESGTLNILGGTIRRILINDINIFAGGLVYVEGGTMKMSGGELRGGAVSSGVANGTNTGAYGGNIFVNGSGHVEITGGLVTGGMATVNHNGVKACGGNIYATGSAKITISGDAVIRDGMALRSESQHAYGGNIYAESNAQVTVSGGSVQDGYSDEDGGNIYLAEAAATVSGDAAVTGGHAYRHGGNIDLATANAVLEMQGGTIFGGVAGGYVQSKNATTGSFAQGSGGGGNIYVYKGTLNLTNCNIAGDIRVDGTDTAVTLAGAAKIGLGKSNGMILHTNVDADVSGLTDGAEIFINAADAFTTAIAATEAERILDYFKGAVRTDVTLNEETYQLVGTQGSTGFCPHCYDPKNPALVTWYSWGGSVNASELHCYMENNDERVSSGSHMSISQDLVLDLNGWTVNLNGRRVLMNTQDKSLVVLDSVGGGKMEGTGSGAANGGLVYMGAKTSLTLLSGILRRDPVTEVTNIVKFGGVIDAEGASANIAIQGGMIYGGVVEATGSAGGGNIYVADANTNLTVTAGIIKGGDAGAFAGGNIYSKGITQISSGFILGGTAANGGNLYTTGQTTISGGTVALGEATNGGNIYFDASTSERTVSGGMILAGAATNGGNLYIAGDSAVNSNRVSVSGGTVAAGAATKMGGNIYVPTYTTLALSGNAAVVGGAVTENGQHGGSIYVAGGTLEMTGGTVTGGQATSRGGNVYTSTTTSKLDLSGGMVSGGQAAEGGNIYLNNGTLDLSATAKISGGNATAYGGNLRVGAGTVTVNLSGGNICNGVATTGGGNIYTGKDITLSGTTVSGGKASNGGSIWITGGTTTVSGGKITGGYATGRGGNFYTSATTALLKQTGGTITGGFAATSGGNIDINNGGLEITGGTVSNGASFKGGNIYLAFYVNGSATIGGTGNPTITGGRAYGGAGGNILVQDEAHQDESDDYVPHATAPWLAIGKCTIEKGDAASFGDNIFVNQKAWIRFTDTFTGETTVYFENSHLAEGNPYGALLDTAINKDNGAFIGTVRLENLEGEPVLLPTEGFLQIAAAALVRNGEFVWYKDNAALVENYGDADHMRPAAGDLVLSGGTYTIDLAGHVVNITGTGAVYGLDSANDTYNLAACGSATFGDGITLAGVKTTVGDKTYFAVKNGDDYTFHRGGMDITSVSLRPSAAGMYYSALWQCDKILADKIDAFGVAVSLVEIPGDDFVEKNNTLYTYQEGFENGVTGNGVLISGIVKNDRVDLNSAYAKMPIYAAAYITMDGENYTGAAESYSLQSMLKLLSDEIYDYYSHAEKLQSFMDKWQDYGLTGEDWQLDYTVPAEVVMLQNAYAGTTAFQGEMHDHADTGGTSDGHYTLAQWLDGIPKLDMDFAAIVDHKQYLHMELEDWDNTVFIGGSEAMAMPKDLNKATQTKMHFNMIFSDPQDLINTVQTYDERYPGTGFNAKQYPEDYSGTDADELAGGWHFTYLFGNSAPTKAQMAELIQIIKDNNGAFVHVHPKSSEYIKSTDPLDYWYADFTGLEVFYTFKSHRDYSSVSKENYQLWTDLLKLGKKVWATAGNDEHMAPSDKAVCTLYATQKDAEAFVEQINVGNFTAGPMGIRMVVGDSNGYTRMGSECDFTGKSLAFSVSDFHRSVLDPTHTYQAVLIADEKIVDRWEISCEEDFYHYRDADASVHYYRIEIYDTTKNVLLGLGNPIWNTAVQ